jgi:uncharacterized membrane-anchored protein YhcB (DUF1043 family)
MIDKETEHYYNIILSIVVGIIIILVISRMFNQPITTSFYK